MVLLGLAGLAYLVVTNPGQANPASGYVICVSLGQTRVGITLVIYVTPLGDRLNGLSMLLVGFGLVGLILNAFLNAKLKKPTPFG